MRGCPVGRVRGGRFVLGCLSGGGLGRVDFADVDVGQDYACCDRAHDCSAEFEKF